MVDFDHVLDVVSSLLSKSPHVHTHRRIACMYMYYRVFTVRWMYVGNFDHKLLATSNHIQHVIQALPLYMQTEIIAKGGEPGYKDSHVV